MSGPRTIYAKLVEAHTVKVLDEEGTVLLYIDRQVLNEYTSPQAFSGLRESGRTVRRPETHLAVVDHINSTQPGPVSNDLGSDKGVQTSYLAKNCGDFGIELFDIFDARQGIEHVVAPEQGFVWPGMVIAAGDSHATTYGAFGSLGFGIGTSGIEHLLATQTLVYQPLKTMLVSVRGRLGAGVTAKDLIMHLIRQIGADGATGYALEFQGEAIAGMSVEGRMTICNMAVECGARGAIIAPDHKVIDYIKGRPFAPSGEDWGKALTHWQTLVSDPGAAFDRTVVIDAATIEPLVTWGTSPDQAVPIGAATPDPGAASDPIQRTAMERSLDYMGLEAGTPMQDVTITHAFIGSCTNARIEDLRSAATLLKGRRVHEGVRAMVVPGSKQVLHQAEEEGLADIFLEAGFEWRLSGCSLCLAMNNDVLKPGERCASSTNRNFEGRQGAGARTHLMSPEMVAAAAVYGRLADVRELEGAR